MRSWITYSLPDNTSLCLLISNTPAVFLIKLTVEM